MLSYKTCPVCQLETMPSTYRCCKQCLARSKEGGVYEPTEEEIYAKAAELRAMRRNQPLEDRHEPVELREYSVNITDKIKLGTARMYNGNW